MGLVFTEPDGTDSVSTNNTTPAPDAPTVRLSSGKAQASLEMLASSDDSLHNGSTYRSYDYYLQRLNTLANTWATQMNALNKMGVTGDYTAKSSLSDGTKSISEIALGWPIPPTLPACFW